MSTLVNVKSPKMLAVEQELGLGEYKIRTLEFPTQCDCCHTGFEPGQVVIERWLPGPPAHLSRTKYYCLDRPGCGKRMDASERVEQARLLANAGEFERFVTVAPRIAQVTLDDYEQRAASTAVYPGQGTVQGLVYTVLGLAGEAGEMANQVKKTLRDDDGVLTDQRRAKLVDELGDVLWYVANTAKELGVPLADIAQQNLNKLQARKEQGTLKGDQREGRTLGIGRLVPAGLKSIEMPIAEGGC